MAERRSVPPVDELRPSSPLTFLAATTDPPVADEATSPTSLPASGWEPDPESLSASDSDELGDEPTGEPSDELPTSSRGSSAERALSKASIRRAGASTLTGAGKLAHRYLTDQAGQQVGLYLVTKDEASAIAHPLVRIAMRHGLLDGAVNPDLADALDALFGIADYAGRQVELSRDAAELRTLGAMASEELPADEDQSEPTEATSGPAWAYGGSE